MFKTNRFIISLVCIAMLFALLPGIAGAGDLPPRPTPPPLPTPTPVPVAAGIFGAVIELRLPTTSLNYFTIVQWQSANQVWHDVDTWQGNLDDFLTNSTPTTAYKRWWVYPADYGKQNFRWQVFNKPNGKLLAASATFDLPTHDKQIVISEVAQP
jgi:hypothetical protein